MVTVLKQSLKAILMYLADWKNWLVHTLVGCAILAVAIFLPVNIWIRIGILVIIIFLNVLRMRYEKKRKQKKLSQNRNDITS